MISRLKRIISDPSVPMQAKNTAQELISKGEPAIEKFMKAHPELLRA